MWSSSSLETPALKIMLSQCFSYSFKICLLIPQLTQWQNRQKNHNGDETRWGSHAPSNPRGPLPRVNSNQYSISAEILPIQNFFASATVYSTGTIDTTTGDLLQREVNQFGGKSDGKVWLSERSIYSRGWGLKNLPQLIIGLFWYLAANQKFKFKASL